MVPPRRYWRFRIAEEACEWEALIYNIVTWRWFKTDSRIVSSLSWSLLLTFCLMTKELYDQFNNQILFDGASVAVALNTPTTSFCLNLFPNLYLAIISIEKRPWVDFFYDTSIYTRYRKHHVQWRAKWCQHCPKCLWWSSWDFLGDQSQKRTPLTKDEESDGWLEPTTTWFNELSATFVWLSFTPSS